MAIADWKQPYKEPEDYGWYLVKAKGYEQAIVARFDHPIGCRHTGWYVGQENEWSEIQITGWDTLPV